MLTYDIYGNMYMTHDQILQHRSRTSNQYGPHAYQRVRYYRASCQCHGSSIWNLQAPSVSICSRSAKNSYPYPDTRSKGCIHYQAGSQVNSGAATIFRTIRPILGGDRDKGFGNIFAQRPSAWQKPEENQNRSSLNIVLIAYRPKSSRWSMNF